MTEFNSTTQPENSDPSFTIENVTVKPAPGDVPQAYEYSDLKHAREWNRPMVGLHLVYWPLYLSLLYPLQLIIRALRWNFWKDWSASYRFRVLISTLTRESVDSIHKARFLLDPDRRYLYLRASHFVTPSQLLPLLPGTAPISEDSNVQRPPDPDDWDRIRRGVYERDNYHCVNCGVGGGPNGDATLQADHVLPVTKGGTCELSNLRTLCRNCHQARHARVFR